NVWLFAFVLLCIALAIISLWQWKKFQQTNILFGWAWIAIMLIPMSGIIAINGLLYEHWLYLPLIGFCIITLEIIQLFLPKFFNNKFSKYIVIGVVIVLSILTMRQNYYWSTPIKLYTYLLQYTDS